MVARNFQIQQESVDIGLVIHIWCTISAKV